MSKNTFRLIINGTDYSTYINYPLEYIDKNLTESFNTYTLSLNRMTEASPLISHQKAEIVWKIDDVEYKRFYTLLVSDAVEKIGNLTKYKHNLNLIEYTYYLELINLPDITITRIEGEYEPTLADVVNRILEIAAYELNGTAFLDGIILSSSTNSLLNSIASPEWTFTRMTLMEALRMVFGYAKVVPTMETFITLGFIDVLNTDETSTKVEKFGSFTEAYNPQSYRTRLTTQVQNFIAGDDESGNASIIEPANGWITPRSPDGYEISNNNAIIPTSRAIYRVEKLLAKPASFYVRYTVLDNPGIKEVSAEDLPNPDWIRGVDLTDALFEEGVYDTLANTEVYGKKGGSLYYTQGEKNIKGLTYRSPAKWSWEPTKQAIAVVALGDKLGFYDIPYHSASKGIKSEYYGDFTWWIRSQIPGNLPGPVIVDYYGVSFTGLNAQNMEFQIQYVPLTETMIYTYRERKTNSIEQITSQTYNQQANVISSEVLGELVDRISKSNSGDEKKYMFVHTNADEMLSIGKRVSDYIITSASNSINYNTITSYYDLDKYFLKLNTYVGVLEKWRQFSIPNENIVKRQMTLNRFAKFSTTQQTIFNGLSEEYYLTTGDKEMRALRVTPSPELGGLFLQATSFPFNNTLVFEGTFEGNANAGNQSEYLSIDKRIDKPVIYTDSFGRIDGTRFFYLSEGFDTFTRTNAHELPIMSTNNLLGGNTFWQDTIFFNKDAREQLSISLQLHHIDTTNKVYINHGLAKYNGLIGGEGVNIGTKILFLNKKPYNSKFVYTADILSSSTATMSMNPANTSIVLPTVVNTGPTSAAVAYAKDLGAGKYEVLYWVDEQVPIYNKNSQLYINFDKEY